MQLPVRAAALLTILALPLSAARADEGMWTFDAFPFAKLRAEYGWAPDQAWLDRVRAASVRLTGGCSASFVSDAGLMFTNHHCIASCLEDLSTSNRDYLKNGYNARTRAEEKPCPGTFALAPAFLANRARIDASGTLDFVYAADTIGGNSGSPVIDRNGAVIGANFDRNVHGLRNNYAYDLTMARSIAVSTAAIEQALKVIYPAPALLAELRGN